MTRDERNAIRRALAEYVASEGCSCCRDNEAHAAAAELLGKLLRVTKYADGSGRDFYRYLPPSKSALEGK